MHQLIDTAKLADMLRNFSLSNIGFLAAALSQESLFLVPDPGEVPFYGPDQGNFQEATLFEDEHETVHETDEALRIDDDHDAQVEEEDETENETDHEAGEPRENGPDHETGEALEKDYDLEPQWEAVLGHGNEEEEE